MFRRLFQQALFVCLAGAGLVGPAGAATNGARELPPAPSQRLGEGSAAAEPPCRVTRWTAENGLPQNNIKALAQTRDGYLWLGTLKGVARFDGVRFKVFDHSNTPEITHDSINGLAVDLNDGGLWIGTGDSLLYYRDHEFKRYGLQEGVAGSVNALCPAREGGVWFSSRPGQVSWAHGGRVQTWEFGPDDGTNSVHQLGEENSAELLVLLGRTSRNSILHRFNWNRKVLAPFQVPEGASPLATVCSSFQQDADESLWLCTGQGIWRGRERLWTRITDADAESSVWPQRIYQTRAGEVWVTQFEANHVSLQRLVEGRLQPPSALEWPTELRVTRVLEDREGDLWVGSMSGLFRIEPKRIRVYSRRDGLPSDSTLAVAKAADGTIWVGTAAGVGRICEGKVANIPPPEAGESWRNIGVFLADQQNALWVGRVDNWLSRFQGETWQTFLKPETIGNTKFFRAMGEDREGRMWVGTGEGVFCNQGGHWSKYTTTNGLSHRDVRVIYQDRRSDLWFGTFGGGLNRWKDEQFTAYKTGRGERNNRMWWIHEDADGVFWVGTEDGLNRFVPPGVSSPGLPATLSPSDGKRDGVRGRFYTFTTEQGLGENVVNNIQEDEFGYLWLSGLRGIYRISRQELNEVAAGKRAQVRCIAYGEADGMLNSECNGGDNQPAGCKDNQGRIWFPTVQGVVVIDPKAMQQTELPPPVVVEQVRANDQVIFGNGARTESKVQSPKSKVGGGVGPDPQPSTLNPRLAPGNARVLEIRYTANSLAAPERVRFKYRLKGHDRDWLRDDQNRRVAFYTNLRPGDYTFQVTACNSHGIWSEPGDQFSFYVAPHFYETWPFYVLSAITAIGLAVGVQTFRLRWQRRLLKLEEQSAIANERTRIARDLHDDLGTALTGLALELDVVGREARAVRPLAEHLGATARRTRDLAERMREVVWTVNPQCDTVSSLASFLEQQISQFLRATEVRVRLDFPEDIPAVPLAAEARHQLALSVREALSNVVRHAQASEVVVTLAIASRSLIVSVTDNGRGFQAQEQSGHGLENMRTRLKQIGGTFKCVSTPSEGTVIEFRLPLKTPAPGQESAV